MSNSLRAAHLRGIPVALLFCAGALLSIAAAGTSSAAAPNSKSVRPPTVCQRSRCAPPAPTDNTLGTIQSYVVTLKSLELISTTGKKVEVLRAPMSVDFAQVIDLEAAVLSGRVPAGDYASANVVIDYSKASITADDGTAKAVTVQPLDAYDNPVTGTAAVTLQLDRRRHLVVSARNAALLALDFNLAATNKVDLQNGVVHIGTTLVADVVPSGNLWVRVNGSLTSATSANDDFVLTVAPTKAINAPARGAITVELSPTTTYKILGALYTGTAGEVVLAALPTGTKVAATGSLHSDRKTLAATAIVAGDS